MKNKSVSDLVAFAMNENLESEAHKSLFGGEYVVRAEQDVACADDNHAEHKSSEDCDMANDKEDDDDDNYAKDADGDDDDNDADDEDEDDNDADDVSLALDTAAANLITASAALDAAGFEKTASLSLQMATFICNAAAKKKKDSKDKKKSDKKKSDAKKSSEKKKSDDKKKSDKKKSDDKKSSEKKKSNPFAKKDTKSSKK